MLHIGEGTLKSSLVELWYSFLRRLLALSNFRHWVGAVDRRLESWPRKSRHSITWQAAICALLLRHRRLLLA